MSTIPAPLVVPRVVYDSRKGDRLPDELLLGETDFTLYALMEGVNKAAILPVTKISAKYAGRHGNLVMELAILDEFNTERARRKGEVVTGFWDPVEGLELQYQDQPDALKQAYLRPHTDKNELFQSSKAWPAS